MDRLLILFLVIVVAFILVSRFIEEVTVKLIFQVVLGAVLLFAVLRYAGVT